MVIMLESWNEDDRLFEELGLAHFQGRQRCCPTEVTLSEKGVEWQGGAWILNLRPFCSVEVQSITEKGCLTKEALELFSWRAGLSILKHGELSKWEGVGLIGAMQMHDRLAGGHRSVVECRSPVK